MSAVGFPCAELLVPASNVEGRAVSIETYLPDGEPLPRDSERATRLAVVLADLVRLAPAADSVSSLDPQPQWFAWNTDREGLWPKLADVDVDLNGSVDLPWIDVVARSVREALGRLRLPLVVGHGDWWSENVRWSGDQIFAVDDWDSVVAQPEAAIAGSAAAVFAEGSSTLAESTTFLDAYAAARGTPWDTNESETAWCVGLWVRLLDARKACAGGDVDPARRLEADVRERLTRAGLGDVLT